MIDDLSILEAKWKEYKSKCPLIKYNAHEQVCFNAGYRSKADEIDINKTKLIEVDEDVFILPEQVVSVEHDIVKTDFGGISDCDLRTTFNGSRITLKNGRKIFIDKVMSKIIMGKLGLL